MNKLYKKFGALSKFQPWGRKISKDWYGRPLKQCSQLTIDFQTRTLIIPNAESTSEWKINSIIGVQKLPTQTKKKGYNKVKNNSPDGLCGNIFYCFKFKLLCKSHPTSLYIQCMNHFLFYFIHTIFFMELAVSQKERHGFPIS